MQTQRSSTHDERDPAAGDAAGDLDRAVPFDLLRSDRRSMVVRHLLAFVDEPVPLDALATAIARREHDSPADGVDPEVRERVAISLEHSHLPKLAAAGIVEDDWRRGRVTATSAIERLEPYVDTNVGRGGHPRGDDTPSSTGLPGTGPATLRAVRDRPVVGFLAGLVAGLVAGLSISRPFGGDDGPGSA